MKYLDYNVPVSLYWQRKWYDLGSCNFEFINVKFPYNFEMIGISCVIKNDVGHQVCTAE
jgi:hypothetical protein